MTIPKHYELMQPVLELLQKNNQTRVKEFEAPLAKRFGLTEEQLNQKYESGNAFIFYDRISWALSYLNIAELVTKPKRGVYQINEKGLELLKTPEKIKKYVESKANERERKKLKEKATVPSLLESESLELTPQEQLYHSYQNIRLSIYEDILNTILSKSPREFEHIVVKLLELMGYGGQVKGAGEVTQASNDGGIDGIIKEDVLGLGRIHIQAKRYKRDNTIGREEIQRFVGALAVAQSNKGVFITTSSYSQGAIDYADSLNGSTTVVLIDGQELAKHIYDYNLGMQTEQVIKIKKMDSDYWDLLKDS